MDKRWELCIALYYMVEISGPMFKSSPTKVYEDLHTLLAFWVLYAKRKEADAQMELNSNSFYLHLEEGTV